MLHVCRAYDVVFSLKLTEPRLRVAIDRVQRNEFVANKGEEVLVDVQRFCREIGPKT